MKKIASAALLACFVLLGCAQKVPENIVARYEYGDIAPADLERQMTTFAGEVLEKISNYSELGGGEQALKDIIAERRLFEKGTKEGLTDTPEFKSQMARKEKELLVSAVERQLITINAEPTEQEIETYFKDNKDSCDIPDQAKVRSIFLPVHPGADKMEEETALLLAEDLMTRILDGGIPFDKIAKEYSKAPSAEKGGEEPLVAKGVYPATVEAEIFSKKEGELTDIVRTRSGYVFFKVEKIIPGREVTLDEVRDKVRKDVSRVKRQRLEDELLDQMTKQEKLTVHPEVFLTEKIAPDAVAIDTASGKYTVDDVFKRFSKGQLLLAAKSGADEVNKYLDRYIFDILMLKKADELGLKESEQIKKGFEIWRVRTMAETYVNQKCEDVPPCTEAEAKATYEANKGDYQKPKTIAFREIFLGVPSGPDRIENQRHLEAARELAEDIRRRAVAGEDFGKLAEKYSTVESASKGGYIDWVSIDMLGPQPYTLADPLKEGDITAPKEVRGGYLLIKMEGVRPPEQMTFEEAKELAKGKFTAQKQEDKKKEILKEAYSMKDVKIFKENLNKALATIKPLG